MVAYVRFALDDGVLPGSCLAGDDVVDMLAKHAEATARLAERLGRLSDVGWTITASSLMSIHLGAWRASPSLNEAAADLEACGAPPGTIVHWAIAPENVDRLPVGIGGLVLDGPAFGEGSLDEILVTDTNGVERVIEGRDQALAALRDAIEAYAGQVARTYPHLEDLPHEILARARELDELRPFTHVDLVEDEQQKRIGVQAQPVSAIRWRGFVAGVETPDRPDHALVGERGPLAQRLALEGHELARLAGLPDPGLDR